MMTSIYISEGSTIRPNYKSQKFNNNKNAQIIKCYLYKASWVFECSYELYLAQNLQLWVPLNRFHLSQWAAIEPDTNCDHMCNVYVNKHNEYVITV